MSIYPETSRRVRSKPGQIAIARAAQALPPLLAGAVVWVLASRQVDPAAAAESRFLALWIGGVLIAASALARRSSWETGVGAVLAPLLVWALPQGPHRGTATCILLAMVLMVATARRSARREPLLDLTGALALCLGTQLLARSDLVLAAPQSARALGILLASAVASAVALWLIAEHQGVRRGLYVGAACLLLGAGWTMTGAGVLLAIAAGCWLGRPEERRWWLAVGWLPVMLWNPLIGGLAGAAMLALVGGWWRLAPAVAVLAVIPLAPVSAIGTVLETAAIGLALVPAFIFAGRRAWPLLTGAILLLCAGGALSGGVALLPGAALAGLALPKLGIGARLQGIWLLFASFCGVVITAYPWLDARPFERVLRLLGAEPGWLATAVLVVAFVTLGWFLTRLDLDQDQRGDRLIWMALFVALFLALPPASLVPLDYQAVPLTQDSPRWNSDLGGEAIGRVSIDCNLVNGAGLAKGTAVLTVQLLDQAGNKLERWTLTSGNDTAEWAAARPDVAALPGFQAPPAWLGYVAPEGGFFGYRYRSRLAAAAPRAAARMLIRRAADLPPEITPVIYRVELQP